jgi:hypothetical protein
VVVSPARPGPLNPGVAKSKYLDRNFATKFEPFSIS